MNKLLRWGNFIIYIVMIAINALANIFTFGGNTTGAVSAKYSNLFTPAPYTFSIWGVIYIFMGFYVIYAVIKSPKLRSIEDMQDSVGIWFCLSCIFNIAWIFTWHFEKIGLSVVCILGLLLSLIIINIRFSLHPEVSIPVRVCIYGFNIYLGWICAAVIANISVFLTKVGWGGFGLSSKVWMMIILVITCLLGILLTFIGGRFMATAALLWAVIGIMVKHLSNEGFDNAYPVITFTLICIAVILWLVIMYYPLRTCKSTTYHKLKDKDSHDIKDL
ncbi:MAG: tryptophan-rich sensory protein [Lachnospiraceae bacterium]|nr:tryptophan-rich sensory protein [Lachnospiraceae bacterium]